jgi:DNA-binding MarR family transcriptional regulator
MRDESFTRQPQINNIRALIQDVGALIDAHMSQFRETTEYASIRPSDAKVFVAISEAPRTISQLARALKISRQAAHASIGRLVEWKMVELQHAPGSRRDKIAVVTEEGRRAQSLAAQRAETIESEIEARIGKQKLEALRGILIEITQNSPSSEA